MNAISAAVEPHYSASDLRKNSLQMIRQLPNEISDKLARVRERLRSRLTTSNLNPLKDYVERDIFEVLIQFTIKGDARQYEALVSRVPATDTGASRVLTQPVKKAFARHGRYFENFVHVPCGKATEMPEWLSVPSTVRIKLADQGPHVLGKSRYFSLKTSRLHWTQGSRSRENSLSGTRVSYLLNNAVESTPEPTNDDFCVPVENAEVGRDLALFAIVQWLSPDHEAYNLFSMMTLRLGGDFEQLEPKEGFDLPIEIQDVYFGPLGFACGPA
jgi:hypothetical protein